MTITEMISLFDLIQDKVDTAYFTDAEKVEFLNTAQNLFVESLILSRDEESALDSSKKIEALLYPVINRDVEIDPASLDVTQSELDTAAGGTCIYVMSVYRHQISDNSYYYCTWVRENERGPFADNTFKVATATSPWVAQDSSGLYVSPELLSGKVKVTTIRMPIPMSDGPATDCELPITTHEKIVAGALSVAGIATEHDALFMMTQLAK